jgi:predicted MFS family arabinose efflux permease
VNSGSALGLILGMSASSLLVKSMGLPWQTMVFISAGLIIFLVAWFAVMIKEPGKYRFEGPAAASTEHHEKASMRSLFTPRLVTLYLLYFTTCYAYYMIVTWLPNFLETERDISGGLVGLITSLIAVTAVPGALFFAKQSDKRRDNKQSVIIFLEISAFILIAVAMFAPNAVILSGILLSYGFLGKMAVDPVLISFVSDSANKRSMATTLGMFNFFGMSSSVVAPALTGWVIDSTGSGEWGFYIGAILLLVGTAVFVANEARERKSRAATLQLA